jgi:hypothetical protein
MLEAETLSPLYQLAPDEELLLVEEWHGVKGVPEVKTEGDAAEFAAIFKRKLDSDASAPAEAKSAAKKARGKKA